ncbi:MAG: EamA family transporter [Gammaproteobacteria bacterium]|nr:EamA family transporter [Gammaproteobacteria bacterium]MDH3406309.1 EamA family transporter [Gammaproteobacteria bacterium]MDH3562992.1 EamA family transporter [Gammaproteobacteria bacterium]MDH5486103.1 EamA family transporter [Gammaproteobacteria bacterium]
MTAAALALTGAVLMHVAWNLLARASHPDTRFLWWALVGYLIILGPWSLYELATEAHWSSSLIGLLIISALANSLYFLMLGAAYRHAPVALVYPIARSSPLLIALWSSLLFREMIATSGWLGILVTVAGLLLLAFSARHGDTRRAVLWAVIAAFATSVYSLSNKFAVTSLPTYGSQLGLVSVDLTVSLIALSLEQRVRLGRWRPAAMPPMVRWLPAGLFIGNAYGLVIFAMQYLSAAYAVAFTNAGIVIAGFLSIVFFKEREQAGRRIAAIVVITGGLAILAWSA